MPSSGPPLACGCRTSWGGSATINPWLRQAKWRRHQANGGDGVDRFLDALNLSSGDPDDTELPGEDNGEDDIEGGFRGAPGWLRRS